MAAAIVVVAGSEDDRDRNHRNSFCEFVLSSTFVRARAVEARLLSMACSQPAALNPAAVRPRSMLSTCANMYINARFKGHYDDCYYDYYCYYYYCYYDYNFKLRTCLPPLPRKSLTRRQVGVSKTSLPFAVFILHV